MPIINNLNFRDIQNKCEAHNITDEILNIENNQAYLLESIEYADGSYATVTITDGNNNQLEEGSDYTITEDAGLITFNIQPITPCKAAYSGVGSIIWAQDVKDLQTSVTELNNKTLNKNGDTLEGELDVNWNNLKNVSTINDIQLWTHDHSSGNGNLIPTTGIVNNAITTEKLGDNSVTTDKIVDGNVTDSKIDTVSRSKLTGALSTDTALQSALDGKLNLSGGTMTGVLYTTNTNEGGANPIAPINPKLSNVTAGVYPSTSIYPYVIKLTDSTNAVIGSFEYSYQRDRYGVGIVTKKWGEDEYSYLKVGWKNDGEMYFEFPKCTSIPTTTSTASFDRVVVITENYSANTFWRRVYSDGWVEQGGDVTVGTDSSYTVNFSNLGLLKMNNTNYSITLTLGANANASSGASGGPVWYRPDTKTVNGFKIINDLREGPVSFVVRGFKA